MIERVRAIRILFVFGWLVVGGEETEVRLLARHLDRRRYQIEVLTCLHRDGMPIQTHHQLRELGIAVDCTPFRLDHDRTVEYLARKMAHYDIVVACQAVQTVRPALARMAQPPAVIEHGGTVREAWRGPKDHIARYVGVCASIRDAAAAQMPGREHHAVQIPSMVDLAEFDPGQRAAVRQELGVPDGAALIGWIGRLDRKKRVEDFLHMAAGLGSRHAPARFVVVGGPDFFWPEYQQELHQLARQLRLRNVLAFLGDRADVPRLMSGLDVLVWLSRGEGMPHVIAEAGAAGLPVVATPDNGVLQQLTHRRTGWLVPYENPQAAADAVDLLLRYPKLRQRLGAALRAKVEREYSVAVVTRAWGRLFDEVAGQIGIDVVGA
jgi:polysaccharide biosynthesis protein PelF